MRPKLREDAASEAKDNSDSDPIRIQESIGHLPGGGAQRKILDCGDRARLIPVGDPVVLPT